MKKKPAAGITRSLTLLAGASCLATPLKGAEILNDDFTVPINSSFDAVFWSAYFTQNDSSVVDWSSAGTAPGFVTGGGDYIFFQPAGDINFDVVNGPGLMFTALPGTPDISSIVSISFDENMDASEVDPATARFAIEVAGQWYASESNVSSITEDGAGGAFNPVILDSIDFTDGANWRLLTVALGGVGTGEITLAGAPVGGTLTGMVNSVGVYSVPGNGGDHSRFDNYIVNDDSPEPPEPPEPFLEEFINDDTMDQTPASIAWTALVTENDEIVSYAQTGIGTATGIARGDYGFHAPKQDPEVANDPALFYTSKGGTTDISTITSVGWDASGDNDNHEFRVAIQIDGIWYASNPGQNDGMPDSGGTPAGFSPMSYAPASFATASNWLIIDNAVIGDPDPLSLGAAPGSDLTGIVTAYGIYVVAGDNDDINGDHIRFDNFTIAAEFVLEEVNPRITSFTSLGGDVYEVTLEGTPSTSFEFYASTTLNFDPGILVDLLTQGDVGDPGTISSSDGEEDNVITTDPNGDATVELTLFGNSTDFVRAVSTP